MENGKRDQEGSYGQRSLELRERDRTILKIAYDHGFLLTEHAAKYFANYSNARRRLQQLIAAGYLSERASSVWFRAKLLVPTTLGRAAAEVSINYRIARPNLLKINRLAHDSYVIHARQRLDELWHGEFVSESRLSKRQDIPDGVYRFASGRKFFLEVENSHKARRRFLARLKILIE